MAKRKPGLGLRYQWLGQQLKGLREARGLKLDEVSAYLECGIGTLSRIETAQYPIRKTMLMALLEYYDVSDRGERDRIFELRDECWRKGWWDGNQDAHHDQNFMDLAWMESRSSHIRWYEPTIVPGLFQTEGYAEAAIRAFDEDAADDQVRRWVDLRMGRQSILRGEDMPTLDAIIDEAVLRRPLGGPDVMMHQLKHLITLSKRPNVSVRVVPFSAWRQPSSAGTFTLFELAGAYPDVGYSESLGGRVIIEEPAALDRFERVYASLDKAALAPSDSQAYMVNALKEIQHV